MSSSCKLNMVMSMTSGYLRRAFRSLQNAMSFRRFVWRRRAAKLTLVVMPALFSLPASAEWREKVLYSFQGGTDGSLPAGGVIFDKAGNLYGETIEGGSTNCPPGWCGTIYQLTPPAQKGAAWTETVLYVFKGHNQNDGSSPSGGLIADSVGNFYGVTGYGGSGPCVLFGTATGCGTVFQLSPPKTKGGKWTEKILYNFKGGNDGDLPTGPLVFDRAGNLYGATEFGGGKGTTCDVFYGGNCGTVFKLNPPKTKGGKWTEKVLHSFAGGTDGAVPNGGLMLDSNGAVYGTSAYGGNQACNSDVGVGCGIAFKLASPKTTGRGWAEEALHIFTGGSDGAGPNASLVFDAHGSLYGTAGGGGKMQNGVVFRLQAGRSGRWNETVLYAFGDGNAPCCPGAGLTYDSSGNLYGVSLAGRYFRGTTFRLAPPSRGHGWIFSVLNSFKGTPDGNHPIANLVHSEQSLYSTTLWGGTGQACQGGCGTVFETDP